jgi:hypothetical protein
VLIANERRNRLALVAPIVTALGREVTDGKSRCGMQGLCAVTYDGGPEEGSRGSDH